MHIIAIAWIYVVLMMSITQHSLTAAVMTFLLYAVLPGSIILYVMGTSKRKRSASDAEKIASGEQPSANDIKPACEEN